MSTVHRRYVGPVSPMATRLDGRERLVERGDVVEVSEEQAEALDRQNVVDDETGEVVEASWEEADASDYTAQQEPDGPPEDAGDGDGQDGSEDGPPEFETATVDDVDEADDDEQKDQT